MEIYISMARNFDWVVGIEHKDKYTRKTRDKEQTKKQIQQSQ